MDGQDHKKNSPPGHENHGLHLCHKCGWPFPNPHPSAKHRRAHKRVCGTIEGYKLIDSVSDRPHLALSDDEHLSDEDQRTPSPKIDKESVKQLGSSGVVGLRSVISEDEVFSDAVTEFSDSGVSSGMEKRLETVKQFHTDGKELVHDLNESQVTNDDGNSDTVQPLHDPMEPPQGPKKDAEISDPEFVGSKMHQSETTKSVTDTGIDGVSTGAGKNSGTTGIDGLHSGSCTVISEAIQFSTNMTADGECEELKELTSSGLERDTEGKENGNEVKLLTDAIGSCGVTVSEGPPLEFKLGETAGRSPGSVVPDSEIPATDRKTLDIVPETKFKHQLQVADGKTSHSVTVDKVFEHEKELTGKLQGEIAQSDVFLDVEPSKCANASVIRQTKVDYTQDSIDGNGQLVEICDSREDGIEKSHLLLVAETLPVIENPELKNSDFKNYEVFKSSFPLDLGPTEAIRPVKDDNGVSVSETHSNVLSSDPARSLNDSPSDIYALEDDFQKDGVLAPGKAEVVASGLRVASNEDFTSDVLGAHPEAQASHTLEGSNVDEKSSLNEDTEHVRMKCSEAIPLVPSTGEETRKTTNSNEGENININETDKNVCVATENGKHSADTMTTSVYPKNSAESENDQNTTSLEQDNSYDHVNCGIDFPDIAGNVVTEGGAEQKLMKHEDTASESIEQLPNSTNLDGLIVSDKVINLRDMENLYSSSSSQKFSDASDGLVLGNNGEVPRSSATHIMVAELDHEDHIESELTPENLNSKETTPLAVDSEFLNKSSVRFEDENARHVTISEQEGDDKIRKKHSSVSVVDYPFASSSPTDSLEGNWGSVSVDGTVLSSQSDVIAVGDTDALSSADTRAPEKSEPNSLKPQTVADECLPDESDVFEAPSFMTLVESEVGTDKKGDSEIHSVQNAEQPKAEALQAGWFPSITNVVNESEGRKKNEEIIAKVTNWSTGKQHGPLKNLLNEAHSENKIKSPNAKQVPVMSQADGAASKNNGTAVTTVSSIMGSETPTHDAAQKEIEKEWSSPARYPIEIKKEKRKGKPYWVPFVCCTSVHQDA